MAEVERRPKRFVGRQMALGFGLVSLTAILGLVILIFITSSVSSTIASMQHDEHSIRLGGELATAVREQTIEIANAHLIGLDEVSHKRRRKRLAHILLHLKEVTPQRAHGQIAALAETLAAIDALVARQTFPSQARDHSQSKAHETFRFLSHKAATEADALALVVESGMAQAHVDATESTRTGIIVGASSALLLVLISIGYTVRLRRLITAPLAKLVDAAQRFGRGEFSHRIGIIGEGEPAAVAVAMDDMAQELMAREAQLVDSERMAAIGQLAAGVAHELNNPIGIIRGYLSTMDARGDVATLAREIEILDEEAAHCQRIAADLLSYSRSDELQLEAIDLAATVRDVVARWRQTVGEDSLRIELRAERVVLSCERTRIKQMVDNLLRNASEHAQRVFVKLSLVAGQAELRFDDDGLGVPESEKSRIFEPFYGLRSGGSGLGLSVCLGIAQAHGGTITVENSVHGGAAFVVRLPHSKACDDQ